VFYCDQTSVFASSIMLCSEEVETTVTRPVQLLLSSEDNMETLLIVLLVVFWLGGGGWGYSRWRC